MLYKISQPYMPMYNSTNDANTDNNKHLGRDVLMFSGGAASGLYGAKKYKQTRDSVKEYSKKAKEYKQRLKDIVSFKETGEMSEKLKSLAKKHKAFNDSALKAVLKDEYKPIVKARRYGALGILGTTIGMYGAKKTLDDINPHPVMEDI